jgi:hypothetical protein
MSMAFSFLRETLGNCSEVKADPRALPSREKLFPDQGHMAVASLRLCSLRNTNAVCEIARLDPPDAVFVNLWPEIFILYI